MKTLKDSIRLIKAGEISSAVYYIKKSIFYIGKGIGCQSIYLFGKLVAQYLPGEFLLLKINGKYIEVFCKD